MSVRELVLVNIPCVSLIDCEALGSFLESGQIGLCGTEVFETEPPHLAEMPDHVILAILCRTGGSKHCV